MKPRIVLFALLPVALFLLPAGVFWVDRSIADGEIPRNVSIAGIDVSGLSYDDAILTVQAYEGQLQTTPALFDVNDHTFRLDPKSVGVELDEATAVNEAISQRTEGGSIERFFSWLGGFNESVNIEVPVTMDRAAIKDQIATWQEVAIPNPAYEGSVAVVDGEVAVEYPQAGERIALESAVEVVAETLAALGDREAHIPVTDHQPAVTDSDVDAAAAQVRRIIASDVTLTNDDIDFSMTFTSGEIARAVYTEINTNPVQVDVLLDEATIRDLLEPRRKEFELPPVSAEFKVELSDSSVTITPSRYGTLMDVPAVTAELMKAAQGSGTGPFPVAQGDEPRLTTEEAEAYGPIGLVSKFTTDTPGENRVHNIHLMADAVDETTVLPGETFSINEVVGQRTLAKGYLEDCAIIGGEVICEGSSVNIGGGVSQFATTLYNAVFYGCYEDVEHQPHSLYFSKYPKVIEATMGYPSPDVKFRNNSDAPVIIRTRYSDTQVSVYFFGNIGGRKCTAEWGEDTNEEEFEVFHVANEDPELTVNPGDEKQIQAGKNGFTSSVTRIITHPDGTKERERTWTWRYHTQDERIAVHPCMVSGEPVNCPVELPPVVGSSYDSAYSALASAGYVIVKTEETVTSESKNDVVLSMSPDAGEWVRPGSTVTLKVGVYSAPPTTAPAATTTTTAPADGG